MDGVGDGLQLVRIDLAIPVHGQLIDERRIHKFRLGGVSASLGHHLFRRGHADGERLVLDNVGGSLVAGADSQAQLLVDADAAPGRIHGVGDAVLVIGRQDKYRLGIGSGFETKNFAHTDSYYFLRNFRITPSGSARILFRRDAGLSGLFSLAESAYETEKPPGSAYREWAKSQVSRSSYRPSPEATCRMMSTSFCWV